MIEEIRNRLRELYTQFVQKYGRMSKAANKRVLLSDPMAFLIMSSLEVKTGHNEWRDADILHRDTRNVTEVFQTENPVEALSYVLGMYGYVHMDEICRIVDKDIEEVLHELVCLSPFRSEHY